MPTISEEFEGFTDFNLSAVFNRSPAIRRSYSRPNSARTFLSAASMAWRLAGIEKSVYGSFWNIDYCSNKLKLVPLCFTLAKANSQSWPKPQTQFSDAARPSQ